jgi:vacuolar-type H+-ATPase subunit I/STV1
MEPHSKRDKNDRLDDIMRKAFRFVLVVVGGFFCLLAIAWATGALYFDLPIAWLRAPLAVAFGLAMLVALVFIKGRWRAMGVVATGFVAVLAWWLTIKPTKDRVWQPCRTSRLGGHS